MQRRPNCSLNAILRLTAVCVVVAGLSASEHHGTVSGAGSPIPGATVTAAQGDKKFVTATDDQGRYSFPDLPDGIWTLQVEALGFAKLSRDVGIAFDAPSPSWELRLCQRKVEMSYSLQSRNVLFCQGGAKLRGSLGVPVKRRRAMLASNPIEE